MCPFRDTHCPQATLEPKAESSNINLKARKLDESVRVAACVLIADRDGKILLTRRSPSLRSFPSCWVLPGGSVDSGESLTRAASREVFEETGLRLTEDKLELLCVWESGYPPDCHWARLKGNI